MKSKQYMAALGKIEPDQAAQERMLHRILESRPDQTRKANNMNKTIKWRPLKWVAPVAACLALAIVGTLMLPKLTSQPIEPTLPDEPPTQTQDAAEEIQQVSLPAMLAGQEVTWENLSTNNEGIKEINVPTDVDWSVVMFSSDGVQLQFSSKDTKVVGTLEDGRKVTVAIEEIDHSPKAAEKGSVSISTSIIEPELNIEVGSTIMELSFMDETGTTSYRCYIAAIA